MPTGIAGGAAVAGEVAATGAHGGPALATLVCDLTSLLQDNRFAVSAIIALAVGQGGQMLQVCTKKQNY